GPTGPTGPTGASGGGGLSSGSTISTPNIKMVGNIHTDATAATLTTIDLLNGVDFTVRLANSSTLLFSNPYGSSGAAYGTGAAHGFGLRVIQGSSAFSITWPTAVSWVSGTAPSLP